MVVPVRFWLQTKKDVSLRLFPINASHAFKYSAYGVRGISDGNPQHCHGFMKACVEIVPILLGMPPDTNSVLLARQIIE